MATIRAFTTIEQSRKLAKILPLDSVDMFWLVLGNTPRVHVLTEPLSNYSNWENYPCWSLAALLNILPEIQGGKPVIALDDNYITYPHMSDLHTKADNIVDACVELILKLHELNLL